jgi:sulfonate transport system ATP-binding protein
MFTARADASLRGLRRREASFASTGEAVSPLVLDRVGAGTLEAIALAVSPGEVVCLSGVSGSGKSRLLRAIADLDPHEGEIRLGSTRQTEIPAHRWRRAVMLVPAESQWWFDTVGEHLPAPAIERLAEDLAALGLPRAALGWAVDRLSSGEKQRLALLRALARGPRALLLDEPTANLDHETTLATERWLRDRIRGEGLAVLWVAHDAEQIRRVGDRHLRIRGATLEERPWR